MPVSVHRWPFVTTVSIEVFSSFTTNITKEARSEGRSPKVGVRSSEHFSLQTASPVPLFSHVTRVSRGYR